MSQKNKKFSFALWSLAVAVAGIVVTVTIPEIRCSIGLLAETCPAPIKVIDLITQTETGEPLSGVNLQFIGIGAPENQYTDMNGYAKINVANKGDVRVILSKSEYPTQDFVINIANDQNMVRIVRLARSGNPQVSSLPVVPPIPTALPSKKITWNDTVSTLGLTGNIDQDFSFICPPNGTIENVLGTDLYSSNSSVCSAAVHAGMLSAREGGNAQLKIRSGEQFYNGTVRNGVASQQASQSNGSFVFLDSSGNPKAAEQTQIIDWQETAQGLRLDGKLDQDFTYTCMPDGTIGNVYGTSIYMTASSICSAAVHAGVIKTKAGGKIQIRIRPGEKFYNGTTQNGVISNSFGAHTWSFSFNRLN